MAIQLTREQAQRIQAMVDTGAYASPQEALDAALSAVEQAATVGFEGSEQELEHLLIEGLSSEELSEEQFWDSLDRRARELLAEYRPGPRA